METDEGWRRAGEAVVIARRHLTQRQLADQARLDVSVVQDVELGRGEGRSLNTLARIAEALGWQPDQIQRIAAGEDPPWRTEAERASALEVQVAALAESVTTLLARFDRLAAQVEQLSHRVERLSPRDE